MMSPSGNAKRSVSPNSSSDVANPSSSARVTSDKLYINDFLTVSIILSD